MKCCYFITFFAVFLITAAHAVDPIAQVEATQASTVSKLTGLTPEKINELTTFIDNAKKAKPVAFSETTVDRDCAHCPRHLQLSGDINKVLEEMKKDPKLVAEDEVPISINRLRFMYYQVKSREEDGSISCSRYLDYTKDLKPTTLDGDMELMAENVFKFEGAAAVQIMDPTKEEIVYYYRGEGAQRNVIVQAVLGKDGGKFRYYYYRPTEKEKNPYNLPSMGVEGPVDATVKKPKAPVLPTIKADPVIKTAQDKIDDKNKFSVDVDPTLETKLVVIPKNLNVAKASISQNIGGEEGVRIGADSKLSLKGNEASINLQNEEGYQYVKVDVHTSLKGDTTRTITVPYEVTLGVKEDKEALKVKGSVVDSTTNQVVTLSLTDSVTTHIRTEFKKDKLTNINSYAIAKDFAIQKDELATIAVGSNEAKAKYISFQHRKAIKDNVTMVLDVRVDENKKASFMYQLKARF